MTLGRTLFLIFLVAAAGCAFINAGRRTAQAATGCQDFQMFVPVPERYMVVTSGPSHELHRGCGNYVLLECVGLPTSEERSCAVVEVMAVAEAEASSTLYSRPSDSLTR